MITYTEINILMEKTREKDKDGDYKYTLFNLTQELIKLIRKDKKEEAGRECIY